MLSHDVVEVFKQKVIDFAKDIFEDYSLSILDPVGQEFQNRGTIHTVRRQTDRLK
jgi:hypothetical protein